MISNVFSLKMRSDFSIKKARHEDGFLMAGVTRLEP